MKFSDKRKLKMKKARCKRNLKTWGLGAHIDEDENLVDIMKLNSDAYILSFSRNTGLSIHKALRPTETVKLSAKKLLSKKKDFENCQNWRYKSKLIINEDGTIKYTSNEKNLFCNSIIILSTY